MSITGWVIDWITRRSAARFESAAADPVGVQEGKLLELMNRNAGTEYGRRYGFATVRSFSDYARQVPVVGYEAIKAAMERVVAGADNVFTAERPVMFAQTSGTTGDPKYIPVTPTCRGREHSDVMRTWTYHAKRSHPDIFDGKVVSLVSPAEEGRTPGGLPFGSTSGLMYKTMPGIVRRAYSIPYEVFEIADYGAKYYTVMRIALEHDVRFLATANPSSILKMCEKADAQSEAIIRDIHDGTLHRDIPVEAAIRRSVERGLRPDPARARALEDFRRRRSGALLPADYWPRLSLIGCWKGGTVGHYLEKFPAWFDPEGRSPVPIRDWGYLSSEARGSVPLTDHGSSGVLTVASNVFEFVAVEELEAAPDRASDWRFLTVGDLEVGGAYYIFITTSGGLYRYDINDVVQVTGRYRETPEIVFLRKGRGMTNITGEKVSVNQIIDAVQEAARATGAVADHFKAEADASGSRYVIRVEFTAPAPDATRKAFLAAFDMRLKETNIEYRSKRDSQRLKPPVLHVMREGWYERGRRAQVEGGMRAFQAKTQLLSPEKMMTQAIRTELLDVVRLDDDG